MIDFIWREATGDLNNIFESSINETSFFSKFNMKQLKKAEYILLKQQNEESSSDYSNEFYSIIPYFIDKSSIKIKHNLRNKFEIIQVLIDILNINESTNWNLKSTIASKYNAMGCFIQELNKHSIKT